MSFKNFIFDMDGTIWDAAIPAAEGFTAAIKADGRSERIITVEDIHKNFGRTLYEIGADWFPEFAPEVQEDIVRKCVKGQYEAMEKCEYSILYPQVAETLTKLSETCGLYIVSNCLDGYVEMFYRKYDLEKLFKDYAFLNHPKENKPENIRYMVEKHKLTDVCYVGDIAGDYRASQAAGVEFIHAAYGYGRVDEAKYRIENFQELLNFVKY